MNPCLMLRVPFLMFPVECSDIYNKISEITQSLMHENRWSGNKTEFTTWWNGKVLFLKRKIIGPNLVKRLVFKPIWMGPHAWMRCPGPMHGWGARAPCMFAVTGARYSFRWHGNDVWPGTSSWNPADSAMRHFCHCLLDLHRHWWRSLFHHFGRWRSSFLRSLCLPLLTLAIPFSAAPATTS